MSAAAAMQGDAAGDQQHGGKPDQRSLTAFGVREEPPRGRSRLRAAVKRPLLRASRARASIS